MIFDNPFTTATFVDYWSKHFLKGKKTYGFPFIENLSFYKSKLPGLYINTGKNLTKGLDLELCESSAIEGKGKSFLIYDVIDFVPNKTILNNCKLGHYAVRQYPGYLIDLVEFKTLDDFLSKTFKKSSRYKLRKYKKRLEESFNISFKAYCGDMSKDDYNSIFSSFRQLLEKRFSEKQISNNNLDKEEWDFYRDVAYPMILEKKAALFVLYNNGEPISVTLSYLSENRIFDAITVFDIDYAKFHLGSIKIMYLIDWCLKNGWKTLDFSKGHFDYKKRWASKEYNFEYHILFDSKSVKARFIAFFLKLFFEMKQYLREKKVNEILHKITFKLKKSNIAVKTKPTYLFVDTQKKYLNKELTKIDWKSEENQFLREPIFDFLYLNIEKLNDLEIFKLVDKKSTYIFKGESTTLELNIKLP